VTNALSIPAPPRREAEAGPVSFNSNTTRPEFLAMVERAKAYIAAGDVFQVVPSQRFSAPLPWPSHAFYRALRRLNPSPYLFHLDLGGFQLAGSSPEILVRLRGGRVAIRPLAGTRPRGATPAEDAALEQDLLADPKERAEHLMLLDLGRNDVGRFARPGSVEVLQSFGVERYSHVMHIVSHVEGDVARREPIDLCWAPCPPARSPAPQDPRHGDHPRAGARQARPRLRGAAGWISGAGRSTCASCCAPPSSGTASSTSRQAPASSPTATGGGVRETLHKSRRSAARAGSLAVRVNCRSHPPPR
jgi:anthranilate synthase component 1